MTQLTQLTSTKSDNNFFQMNFFPQVTSSSQVVRDIWCHHSICVGCGVQLVDLKKIGWRRKKVVMIPLTIDGKVYRGCCLTCSSRPAAQQPVASSSEESLAGGDAHKEDDGNMGASNGESPYRQQEQEYDRQCDNNDYEHPLNDSKQAPEPRLPSQLLTSRGTVYYEGGFNAYGQPHGHGEMIFTNGDRYHGQFFNGKLHGQGKMLFANGSEYEGRWQCGFMHGNGTFRFQNGDVYFGEYQNSKRSGHGWLHFSNGDLYTGSWQEGQMHGLGRYHYCNGHKFEGNFVMGKRHGKGKYQMQDGRLVIHKYVHDQRVGEGVQWSADRTQVWRSVGGERKRRITLRRAEVIMLRCDED